MFLKRHGDEILLDEVRNQVLPAKRKQGPLSSGGCQRPPLPEAEAGWTGVGDLPGNAADIRDFV
jgi:hypothetical protein